MFPAFFGPFVDGMRVAMDEPVMKNIRFSSVAFLLLTLIGSACSETPVSPTSPSSGSGSLALTAGQLAGVWTLTTLQPPGQAAQASPATYTLAFADGRLSTRADCNVCGGTFTLSDQTLTAGPNMACTRAACPTMAFENAYVGMLAGEHTVELSGKTLVLSSSRGRLAFTQ